MTNRIFTVILCSVTVFLCGHAHAAELQKSVTLSSDVLTVGDVFAGAGNNADHVLGPAPKPGNVLVLDTKTLTRIASTFDVDWQTATRMETSTIRSKGKNETTPRPEMTGMVKVPVLAAPVKRDDAISAADILWKEIDAKELDDNTALKESDVVGLAARGLIQPNTPLSVTMFVSPKVIKRGDMVTLTLSAGRINLTAQGRALADARMGEIVRVQNPDSEKIVQARVTGPQEAKIEPQS